ncbi:hypothetical protein [Massilia pseudoviolaceinigra]|uniref:hypothetical protein n=1 Tax=Massilia pseudoviolaceinigra TaxID=3057165 RepID=UPI0027966D27|nr:hypothetical protein [Massilia sp. CCM 9206]MDQ1924043.1 hypothetical protein [Massilia sp. CCM 9206]
MLPAQVAQPVFALAAGVLERHGRRRRFGFPLRLVERVIAAVAAQAARIEFNDPVHAVQQVAVVADDERAAAPCLQLRGQPAAGVAVEVVRRLIQHQPGGTRQKGADRCHAHQFAAAQAARVIARLQTRQSSRRQRITLLTRADGGRTAAQAAMK